MKVEDIVTNLIKDIIENNNYILDSVEYVYEDGNNFLRVVIDKNGFIDIDDCVTVSKLINPILDENGQPIMETKIVDLISFDIVQDKEKAFEGNTINMGD